MYGGTSLFPWFCITIPTRMASRSSLVALRAPLPNARLASTNTVLPNSTLGIVLSVPLVSASGHTTRVPSDPSVKLPSRTTNQRAGGCGGRVLQKRAMRKTRKIPGWTRTNLSPLSLSHPQLNDAESKRTRAQREKLTTMERTSRKQHHAGLRVRVVLLVEEVDYLKHALKSIHYSTLYSLFLVPNLF